MAGSFKRGKASNLGLWFGMVLGERKI